MRWPLGYIGNLRNLVCWETRQDHGSLGVSYLYLVSVDHLSPSKVC